VVNVAGGGKKLGRPASQFASRAKKVGYPVGLLVHPAGVGALARTAFRPLASLTTRTKEKAAEGEKKSVGWKAFLPIARLLFFLTRASKTEEKRQRVTRTRETPLVERGSFSAVTRTFSLFAPSRRLRKKGYPAGRNSFLSKVFLLSLGRKFSSVWWGALALLWPRLLAV
jgi:hypothetical protein